MTQKDKELLLIDLCVRLSYGVKVSLQYRNKQLIGVLDAVYPTEERIIVDKLSDAIAPIDVRCGGFKLNESNIMPYLRPMSSMTEEEKKKLGRISCEGNIEHKYGIFYRSQDYLNSIHVDYRGLIEKGLALEAPKDIYNIK